MSNKNNKNFTATISMSGNNIVLDGYLTKEGAIVKSWKRRYFVLEKNGQMTYYKDSISKKKIKSFNVTKALVSPATQEKKRPNCLVIATVGRKYYIDAGSEEEMKQWIQALTSSGAIYSHHQDASGKTQRGNFLVSAASNVESTQSGASLSDSLTLSSQGEDPINPIYQQIVLSKIAENKMYFQNKDCEKLARSLCNKAELRRTYLNNNTDAIAKLVDILEREKSKTQAAAATASSANNNNNNNNNDDDDDWEAEDAAPLTGTTAAHFMPVSKHLKVKLVITEMASNSKTMRQLLSPVLNSVPALRKEFGMFHTALIVGPWYLEWTASALVIPRRIGSEMAFIAADLDELASRNDFADLADQIAEVVVDWNVNYSYKNLSIDKSPDKKVGNCQDFVEAMLTALGVSFDFQNGALGEFLKEMREKGTSDMRFKPSMAFRKRFQLKEKSFEFKTHKEFDAFVDDLMAVCSDFNTQFKDEYILLKSFDRAFWLRHIKKPHIEQYQPMQVEDEEGDTECKCPFGDPRDTGSVV